MRNVFIGGAWPYANGSLHLGRLASVLPGDVLARYHRAKGDRVLYVSGSDCHGTPVAVQAAQEGVEPKAVADRYHHEFAHCFERLGFTYDLYTRTDEAQHHRTVQDIFLKLLQNGHLDKRTVLQTYCEADGRFLPDRYVEGTCPHCGETARGDQCDYCSALLDPAELKDRKCKLCGNPPVDRPAVWVPDIMERYPADSIRYFLIANGPERRDTDFSWREFIHSHNGELLGAYGNFVNRTLAFIVKSFDSRVPAGTAHSEWSKVMDTLYARVGEWLESARFKEALELIFDHVRRANKYFDEERPWATYREQPEACSQTLYVCVQIIANLSQLLNPFLPESSKRIRHFLELGEPAWVPVQVSPGQPIREAGHLFERIPPERIQEEERRLQNHLVR